jgi:hypothetical protein
VSVVVNLQSRNPSSDQSAVLIFSPNHVGEVSTPATSMSADDFSQTILLQYGLRTGWVELFREPNNHDILSWPP